jgi:hypothetical protein
MIKDHVIETDNEGQKGSRPILSVQSLWRQACMRLLDIDTDAVLGLPSSPASQGTTSILPPTSSSPSTSSFSLTQSSTSSSSSSSSPITTTTPTPPPSTSNLPLGGQGGTWDQKYFSQIELTDSGRVAIQDMMLNILRISVRCLLSRDDVEAIEVAVRGER